MKVKEWKKRPCGEADLRAYPWRGSVLEQADLSLSGDVGRGGWAAGFCCKKEGRVVMTG